MTIPDAAWFALAVTLGGGGLTLVWRAASTMTSIDARLLAMDARDAEVLRRLAQVEDTLSAHVSKTRSDIAELRERQASTSAAMRWSRPDTEKP